MTDSFSIPAVGPDRGRLAWVTGAGGLIGHWLVRTSLAGAPGWNVVGLTRRDLELTDFSAVRALHAQHRPSLIIHCAAMSRTTDCERDPAVAQQVNVAVPRFLAELPGSTLVHFSSDLVFDGRQGHYREDDQPNPLGVYAETKLASEQAVLAYPRHMVIRTSLNGGISPTGDRGFNELLRQAWERGQTVRLFKDEYRCPLPVTVTARAVWELALQGRGGVYHVAGAERLSRWEIGELVAGRHAELNPGIQATSLQDYAGPPRAPDASLNCHKAQARLSFRLPGLAAWLAANPTEPF
jgi:dTDP-4-dehydrorhamnose reductase